MNLERLSELLLGHFSQIVGMELLTVKDLAELPSKTLLVLGCKLEEELLPHYVQMLKEMELGESIFHKLMGEHEEENRELVDRFFERYMNVVMEPKLDDYNPLLAHLPADHFHDLAFIQSREVYFKSQTIQIIVEFLGHHFHEVPPFEIADQNSAWNWFWNEITKTKK